MNEEGKDGESQEIPAWLLGLIIAAALFLLGLLVFRALGFGDNPVLEQGVILFPNAARPVFRYLAAEKARTTVGSG